MKDVSYREKYSGYFDCDIPSTALAAGMPHITNYLKCAKQYKNKPYGNKHPRLSVSFMV